MPNIDQFKNPQARKVAALYHIVGQYIQTPKVGGFKFPNTKPFGEMKDFAEAKGFKNHPVAQGELGLGDWYRADMLATFFKELLECPVDEGKLSLLESNSWRLSKEKLFQHHRGNTTEVHWRTGFFLYPNEKSRRDSICFLTTEDSLDQDTLTPGEVACIAGSGFSRLPKRKAPKQVAAPVTVVSASGKGLRVIQGCADNDGLINLFKTSFIKVDGALEQY
ncbi:uncharacterized protein F4822DRAFT_429162 [Hypoxylon trugodes]|uniref:uncharacterized protein n=1 Tax=Hypoxylon trugodes TaxID=326681 RepID=UPI00219DF001|nr:uncharacterized protein F4822DRAFT_429162 [Hypoxylon trugodes]KAI1388544.1 hypothetical protein F4822DRAFT_429162 [Hypoxylon trugodes]